MPLINVVQSASAINTLTGVGPASGPHSISCTFPSNVTAGNTIIMIALVGGGNGAGYGIVPPVSVTDTLGNTYTQVLFQSVGNQSGAAIAVYYVTNAIGGADTVTFTFTAPSTNFGLTFTVDPAIVVVEYVGMGIGPLAIQGLDHSSIFGAAGNSVVTLQVTDSFGVLVSVNYGTSPSHTIGTINTGCVLIDILIGGVNYLIAAALSSIASFPAPASTYQTFIQEQAVTGSYTMYYWDYGVPGPNVIVQSPVTVMT